GGSVLAAVGSAALHWVQILSCDFLTAPVDTDNPALRGLDVDVRVEGIASIWCGDGNRILLNRLADPIDFEIESCFDEDDYFVMAARTDEAGADLTVRFTDIAALWFEYTFDLATANVWTFLKVDRATLNALAPYGFDWSQVTQLAFSNNLSSGKKVWLDDIRLSKACAADDEGWNDTGGKWLPSSGVGSIWHIETDAPMLGEQGWVVSNAEGPSDPTEDPGTLVDSIQPYFCLAQLNTVPGERWVNMLTGNYTIAKHFICGIYLTVPDSRASIVCAAVNQDNSYSLQVDHENQRLRLRRMTGGAPTTLKDADYPVALNSIITVALERDGDELRV
ncbi:MAG TPA: hypothetical protein VII92_14135, partial [Anaerolineae bacterium]